MPHRRGQIDLTHTALASMRGFLREEIRAHIAQTCIGIGPYYPQGAAGPAHAEYDMATMDAASKSRYRSLCARLRLVEDALESPRTDPKMLAKFR